MTGRRVESMTVPAGERVLDLLPRLAEALAGSGPALLPLGAADPRADRIAAELRAGGRLGPAEDDPDDPTALVMPTSGSTGLPKGVLLSAGQLAASAAATERRLGGPGSWLLALPAAHIAGMQVLLRAARAGAEPVVLPDAGSFTAANFVIRAARLSGARRYVSLVPTQLARVVADADAAAATAETFDAVLVGGAATPAALIAAARAVGIRVVTTYGMTETCGGCIYDGTPLGGVRAELGASGELRLAGPTVARGYRGRPRDPAFPEPGVFVTSDTGRITADADGGQYVEVTGRVDDMIISGGVTIAPGPVQEAIRALEGIADVLVVGVPDPQWGAAVVALVVPGVGTRWDTASLRSALASRGVLPRTHLPQAVILADAIPQLPSGKPDRAAARALIESSRGPGPAR